MAVRTRDDVTLASIADVAYARRFYLMQGSTLNPPAAPTANPPGGAWTTTEPAYREGSTDSLYTVDLTSFSDGTFDYSLVSKSSSYEAAKIAYNKAASAAAAVLTMSGSKTRVYYSDKVASGTTEAVGDLWRQIDASKNVIAEWYWTGGAWQVSQITTSQIANLDVGKLTAGSAVINQLVAQRIVAATADIQTVNAANLFVTGTAALSTAVVEKLWAEVVRAKMVSAEQFIGENAILHGSITTDKLDANAVDGMVVTGATVQTHAAAARGGKLTSAGLVGYNESGTPVTSIDFKTGVLSAQGAKISGDISGSRMIGGYIEAPTIASSQKLGSGANVLADPDLTGTINAAWVASGHVGDADPALQKDTIVWDQSYRQEYIYPAGFHYYYRNWGHLIIDTAVAPVARRVGTVTFSHRAFLNRTARTFSNPHTFVKEQKWAISRQNGGGANDPTVGAVSVPDPVADTDKTSYLTNTATVNFVAGTPWALALGHAALGDAVDFVSAWVQVVRASDSAVVWEQEITKDQLRYGTPIRASIVPTVTQSVKLRIKSTYKAAGGGIRRYVQSGYARQTKDGVETSASLVTAEGMTAPAEPGGVLSATGHGFGYYNADSPRTAGRELFRRSNVHWYITTATLSQVTPEKGWTLDKESGLRLFNANGAQTGAINGESNFLSGKFATNPTGKRTELDGDYVVWYDANNQPVKRVGITGTDSWNGTAWVAGDTGGIKYAEYTTAKANIPNTTFTDVGNLNLLAAASTQPTFITPASDGRLRVHTPGIYSVSTLTRMGDGVTVVNSTGLTFIELLVDEALVMREAFGVNFDSASLSHPNVRLTKPNQVLGFRIYRTAARTDVAVETYIRIHKVA